MSDIYTYAKNLEKLLKNTTIATNKTQQSIVSRTVATSILAQVLKEQSLENFEDANQEAHVWE